jgi:hypothetical protein
VRLINIHTSGVAAAATISLAQQEEAMAQEIPETRVTDLEEPCIDHYDNFEEQGL